MMKIAFYFFLKACFILKIFRFLSWPFDHVIKKVSLEVQDWFQNLWHHKLVNNCNTLPNIAWSKGNQTAKFGQLIEYSKRNIFLQKSCWKWGRKTSCRPLYFFEKKDLMWGKSKNSCKLFFICFSQFFFVKDH